MSGEKSLGRLVQSKIESLVTSFRPVRAQKPLCPSPQPHPTPFFVFLFLHYHLHAWHEGDVVTRKGVSLALRESEDQRFRRRPSREEALPAARWPER